jgi:predicted aspartyl protease
MKKNGKTFDICRACKISQNVLKFNVKVCIIVITFDRILFFASAATGIQKKVAGKRLGRKNNE